MNFVKPYYRLKKEGIWIGLDTGEIILRQR